MIVGSAALRLKQGCLILPLVKVARGCRRGNNANNTNLSPLYVNGNNTPSNANSNLAFGNYAQYQIQG